MERKTKINAEEGRQELTITREFELPLALLFKAHEEPEIIEQWMSHEYGIMKVLKLENRNHGSWQYETKDAKGNVVLRMHGTIHEFVPNKKIIRTFEMENAPFPAQLEFMEFEALSEESSQLTIHIIYRSVDARDQMIRMGFGPGINGAHDRLEKLLKHMK